MSKSTAQLRKELAGALADFRKPFIGDMQYSSRASALADAAGALLDKLGSQPSRSGKPFRVTFQHQRGVHGGHVYRESFATLAQAVAQAHIPMGAGTDARVALSIRNTDGSYMDLTPEHLAEEGYPEFTGYRLYGDAHYSQGA
jgi:hypothetical protein